MRKMRNSCDNLDPFRHSAARQKNQPWLALAAFLILCYAVAAIGSLSTIHSIPTWYAALNKPSFNPPN